MFSEEQVKMLNAGLDASAVSKRKGAGSMQLSYIEGHHAIDTANRIFGYDGWTMEVTDLTCLATEDGKTNKVHYRATVRVTVGDTVRQDVGYGNGSDKYSQGAAHELACKEAVTDAMKRALRTFGNQFGNSLYEKSNPLHNGGADSKAAKLDKEESEKLAQTLSMVITACQTKNELQNELKAKGFQVDAKSLDPAHYSQLQELAKTKLKELS